MCDCFIRRTLSCVDYQKSVEYVLTEYVFKIEDIRGIENVKYFKNLCERMFQESCIKLYVRLVAFPGSDTHVLFCVEHMFCCRTCVLFCVEHVFCFNMRLVLRRICALFCVEHVFCFNVRLVLCRTCVMLSMLAFNVCPVAPSSRV